MMYERRDFEVMAPAGSREALAAAIAAGADSVYFGIGILNMRAHATGAFGVEDLPAIAEQTAAAGVKSYLALNTVMFDEDLETLKNIVDSAKKAGISAIIAADAAVLTYCRSVGMPVHLSTQINIANVDALRFYAPYAEVAVLARELNLRQVKAIHTAINEEHINGPDGNPLRLEMFCHGALCMAVSGKCYMSLATRGYSANRGNCFQTCRRTYLLKDTDRDIELSYEEGDRGATVMSPKDLCTIEFVDRMAAAGVRVFKIEGRARSPEYVRTVTACYRKAIEAVCEGSFTKEKAQGWKEELATVFNRGFWDGYYLGKTVAELTDGYGSLATEKKVYVGDCRKFYSKLSVGEFIVRAAGLKAGDKLLVTGPTTGAVYVTADVFFADDVRKETGSVIDRGAILTVRVPEKIREHDKLYRIETVKEEL